MLQALPDYKVYLTINGNLQPVTAANWTNAYMDEGGKMDMEETPDKVPVLVILIG